MKTWELLEISPGGEIKSLGDSILPTLGKVQRVRASHIVPVNPVKRAAFTLLRCVFGERGVVASWTRTWRGPWMVTLVGSSKTFYHPSRRVCIEWERSELQR